VVDARPVESDRATFTVAVPSRTAYLRAQLVDSAGEVVALTSPAWCS
jgi:hypothetical protein